MTVSDRLRGAKEQGHETPRGTQLSSYRFLRYRLSGDVRTNYVIVKALIAHRCKYEDDITADCIPILGCRLESARAFRIHQESSPTLFRMLGNAMFKVSY